MSLDDSSSSQGSDAPAKHSPKRFGLKGHSHALYIVLPLLLINAGIVHTVINQVSLRAGAESKAIVVKDETATLPAQVGVTYDKTIEDTIVDTQPVITTYIVKKGDTLSGIADKFNISINTVRWANDLTAKSAIKPGDDLVILPVSGVEYTVKKGDTLSGIALKFDADQADILSYNDIEKNAITVGAKIIIPGAEPIVVPIKVTPKKVAPVKQTTPVVVKKESPTQSQEVSKDDQEVKPITKTTFSNPIPGAVLTQLLHDGNAVDFGAAIGTTVEASAAGTVIIAKGSGYNGGYGNYIVINHTDGSQTLYGHLSSLSVSVGDTVSQGQTIAKSGNSGKSTGPHLHFKIMNGPRNPFATFKKGTQF